MKKLIALILAMVATPVMAQVTTPTLTFTAQTTTGSGSVTPVLSWSTAPAATSCSATGDVAWAGTKAASGTQTLAATTKSATYELACTWNTAYAKPTWILPTKNTDGTALTDLKNILVYFSRDQATLESQTPVTLPPTATTTNIGPLQVGTWYFGGRAVNNAGVMSSMSNIAQKVIVAQTVTRTVSITVNPMPMALANFAVE